MLTNFIGDAELKSVMTDGYNAYVFIGDELSTVQKSPNLKKAIHQVCMAHWKAKLDKALEQAGDIRALPFLMGVDFYYKRGKHSIASEAFCMNQVSFALQNIKIRLWQAVKISKGYWNFITRSPRQMVFR